MIDAKQRIREIRAEAGRKGGKSGTGANKSRKGTASGAILTRWRKGVKWHVPRSLDLKQSHQIKLRGIPFWHSHMKTPKPRWAGRPRYLRSLPMKFRHLLK